jgi:CRISPR-associated protein Csm4
VKAVRMWFDGGLRLGAFGHGLEGSEEVLGADRLYSALTQACLDLVGQPVPGEVRISSAFPFVEDEFFFPRPILPIKGLTENPELRTHYGKKIKQAQFIPHQAFFAWLAGRDFDMSYAFEGSQEQLSLALANRTVARVALDRQNASSTLYFVNKWCFRSEKSGLFCMVDCAEEEWKLLKAAFTWLEDRGVGGKKSSGYGCFTCEFIDDYSIPDVDDPRCWVTVSCTIPGPGEESELIRYQLTEKHGWVDCKCPGGPTRKQSIWMIKEGAVFSSPNVRGSIVDVAPPGHGHPVWRYGLTFLLPSAVEVKK